MITTIEIYVSIDQQPTCDVQMWRLYLSICLVVIVNLYG